MATNSPIPTFSNFITVKLTNTNFPLRKTQVSPYLRAHKLYPHGDGTAVAPTDVTTTAYADWVAKDQLVLAILTSSLSEPILAQTIGCTTAHQAWKLLHDLFAARSSAQVVQVRLQLATIKKGGDSVSDFFNKVKNLVDLLSAAGQTITDDEVVVYTLAGLGSDYESLVTSISTMTNLPSPHQLLSHLLSHEARLAHAQTGSSLPPITANATGVSFAGDHRRRGQQHNRGRSRPFHPQHTNGRLPGGRTFSGQSDGRPICQMCSKPGHTALVCYNRFNQAFQAPPPPSLQANSTTAPWYPDTAASHHFTPDISNLRLEQLPYSGSDSITLGDGSSIPIQHHGLSDSSTSSAGNR